MSAVSFDVFIPSNSILYELFKINTTENISTWLFKAYIYDYNNPSVSLQTPTVTVDTAAKTVLLSNTIAQVATLMSTADRKTLRYVILCRPSANVQLPFFTGRLVLESDGGPQW